MIETNADLKKSLASAHSEFYPVARIEKQTSGDIKLNFAPEMKVVIRNRSLRQIYSSAMGPDVAGLYMTREEFQSPDKNKKVPENHRLVTIGSTIEVLSPYDAVSIPVLLRNGDVPESGCLTYQSGLLSKDPQTALWEETNEELGIIADGQIVFINPQTGLRHLDDTIMSYKKKTSHHNPTLRNIFESNAEQPFKKYHVEDRHTKLRTSISFSGIYGGEMKLIAIDNPESRTLNLIQSIRINLRAAKNIKVFDPEMLNRETEWLDIDPYTAPNHKTTYALAKFLEKTL